MFESVQGNSQEACVARSLRPRSDTCLLILSMMGSRNMMCSDLHFWTIPLVVAKRVLGFRRNRENNEVATALSKERQWWLGPGWGQRDGKEKAGKDVNFKSRACRPRWWGGWGGRWGRKGRCAGLMSFSRVVFCLIQTVHRTRAGHQMPVKWIE